MELDPPSSSARPCRVMQIPALLEISLACSAIRSLLRRLCLTCLTAISHHHFPLNHRLLLHLLGTGDSIGFALQSIAAPTNSHLEGCLWRVAAAPALHQGFASPPLGQHLHTGQFDAWLVGPSSAQSLLQFRLPYRVLGLDFTGYQSVWS